MNIKAHSDPITYHAFGKLRGKYYPSEADPTTGQFITDDGTTFKATISAELLPSMPDGWQQSPPLGIWRSYFRTSTPQVQLVRMKTADVEKDRHGKYNINEFRVDGEVISVKENVISVLIKKNKGDGKPFKLRLKGEFDYDPNHRFWRFQLQRKGKSYYVVKAKKIGLPQVEQVKKKEKKTPSYFKQPQESKGWSLSFVEEQQPLSTKKVSSAKTEPAKTEEKRKPKVFRLL